MYFCQYLKLKYTLYKNVSSKLLSQNDYHKNLWHTPRTWNSIKESFIEQLFFGDALRNKGSMFKLFWEILYTCKFAMQINILNIKKPV